MLAILGRLFVLMAFCAATMIAEGNAAEPPQPLIVTHRGLLRHAPENTLANFRAWLELRLGFEFDIERTKDGHLVCIHYGRIGVYRVWVLIPSGHQEALSWWPLLSSYCPSSSQSTTVTPESLFS